MSRGTALAGTDVALSPEGLGTRLAQMAHYPCTQESRFHLAKKYWGESAIMSGHI